MIDWLDLAFNALWIAGCALALAVLSIANWQARERGIRLRDQLTQSRAALAIAATLFSAGMCGTSQALWERIAWAVLILAFISLAVWSARSMPKST
jgi:uncharacterized membrane protein YidH (DUF202 family)